MRRREAGSAVTWSVVVLMVVGLLVYLVIAYFAADAAP